MGSNDWFRDEFSKVPNYSWSLLNKSKEAYFDKLFANFQKTIDSIKKKLIKTARNEKFYFTSTD